MENFDRENIDELLEICQILQYFPPSKFCTIWYMYVSMYIRTYACTICVVYLVVILIWWFGKCRCNFHSRNELIYLLFRQIKMIPTLFLNRSPNIRLANKSTYMVYWRLNDYNDYVLYNYVHACNNNFLSILLTL